MTLVPEIAPLSSPIITTKEALVVHCLTTSIVDASTVAKSPPQSTIATCMLNSEGRPGAGLGMMWGISKALSMLSEAGLQAQVVELEFDQFNGVYLCRTSPATAVGTQAGGPAM